jgi:hypothetical protein
MDGNTGRPGGRQGGAAGAVRAGVATGKIAASGRLRTCNIASASAQTPRASILRTARSANVITGIIVWVEALVGKIDASTT